MKKAIKTIPAILLVLAFISSCNLPFQGAQDITENVPPNLTLTALFDTSMNIPPTVTPAAPTAVQENTPTTAAVTELPTEAATDVPTVLPVSTNTSVPPTPEVRQRGGSLMKAAYLSTAPVMDGHTRNGWMKPINMGFRMWCGRNPTGRMPQTSKVRLQPPGMRNTCMFL